MLLLCGSYSFSIPWTPLWVLLSFSSHLKLIGLCWLRLIAPRTHATAEIRKFFEFYSAQIKPLIFNRHSTEYHLSISPEKKIYVQKHLKNIPRTNKIQHAIEFCNRNTIVSNRQNEMKWNEEKKHEQNNITTSKTRKEQLPIMDLYFILFRCDIRIRSLV